MADPKPPFPLPDLPRISPPSDLALLACRVLEWRDMEALTRLPDMLRDMGRDADANRVEQKVGRYVTRNQLSDSWMTFRNELLEVVVFDVFDWASTLRVLGERFAAKPAFPGISRGSFGRITVGNVDVPITEWRMYPEAEAVPIPSFDSSIIGRTDDELHASESHPDYEYTNGSRPDAADWVRNFPAEESNDIIPHPCWRRRKGGAA